MCFRDDKCELIIKSRWYKFEKTNENNIRTTLHLLGEDLVEWNKQKFDKVNATINKTKGEIKQLRLQCPNENIICKELELNQKLNKYVCREKEL